MKILLAAMNAKYIHSNLAVHSLRAYAGKQQDIKDVRIETAEYTINQQMDEILKGIYQQMGYSIYSKQLDVSNANFITFVKECDQMLTATTEQNAILKIEQEVLASYEKMVIQKH